MFCQFVDLRLVVYDHAKRHAPQTLRPPHRFVPDLPLTRRLTQLGGLVSPSAAIDFFRPHLLSHAPTFFFLSLFSIPGAIRSSNLPC